MGVSQVVVCDCCEAALEDTSVLHCAIFTFLNDASGQVEQHYYGKVCGCAQAIVTEHIDGLNHDKHPTPEPPADPVDEVLVSDPQGQPETASAE